MQCSQAAVQGALLSGLFATAGLNGSFTESDFSLWKRVQNRLARRLFATTRWNLGQRNRKHMSNAPKATPFFESIPDTPVLDDPECDQSMDRQHPGPVDEICSVISDACSAPSDSSSRHVVRTHRNTTPTEWYETLQAAIRRDEEREAM